LRHFLLVGDKGIDCDALRDQMRYHRGFYQQRHKIQNFFQRLKIYKRLSTRYEKLALTFLSFILLGAIFDWLKSF
jgi:transposase